MKVLSGDGGVPYWDMEKDYPVDSKGEKMMLLAQINFSDAALKDKILPTQGMLQFFFANEDDVYGMDWEEADSQKDFRVIYHEEIDTSVTKEQVLALNIPIATSEDNEYTPVFKEAAVEIAKTVAYLGTEDYLFDELCSDGHWMLGYPYFTQNDPREYREDDYYDTLLFQMDSDMIDGRDYVLWGDCGVANFFMNEEALKNRDFSKVMYNWDCC